MQGQPVYSTPHQRRFRTVLAAAALILTNVIFPSVAAASYDPGSQIDATVQGLLVEPDGKILISGFFSEVRGVSRPGFARLLPDGNVDLSFLPRLGFHTFIKLNDGKILSDCGVLNPD